VIGPRHDREPEVVIEAPAVPLEPRIEDRLRSELGRCPDLAFAHLPQVRVPELQPAPQLTLFVWLVPEALGSLRGALNLVCEAVARALPEDRFLDVAILNSAPEMLAEVEAAGCLLVERDPGERQRARAAADELGPGDGEVRSRRRWPW
jgi:hypothetical protein